MRFRNITSEVRHVADVGETVGPGGELDWPGYDLTTHGVVPGFEPLDGKPRRQPKPPADDPAGDPADPNPDDPASGSQDGGTPTNDDNPAGAAAASEETPQ